MHAFRCWRWGALTVLFVFAAPAAQAEWITPDSIPNPPSAVGSAAGTYVYSSNLANEQYARVGVTFPGLLAITHLDGTSVWAPIKQLPAPGVGGGLPANPPVGRIDYNSLVGASLVIPGKLTRTSVSSLSVEVLGQTGAAVNVAGFNGQPLNLNPRISSIPGGQLWAFSGAGISSFTVTPPLDPLPNNSSTPAWGVSGISFTPSSAPEPSSLVLAGLGALGLATRVGWRRSRRVA